MSQSKETPPISDNIAKLRSIKYFTPARTIEEANSTIPKVDVIIENYIKALGPWKRENDTVQHASDSLWDLTRVTALKEGRNNTWDSTWDIAWKEASNSARDNYDWYGGSYISGESARDAARDAAKYAARYMAFESVKDKLNNVNPFGHIIELYSVGLRPTYFRMIDAQEKFVVDFPMKIGTRFLLGCYVHGDKEILFTHEWKEYCRNLKSIKEQETEARTLG